MPKSMEKLLENALLKHLKELQRKHSYCLMIGWWIQLMHVRLLSETLLKTDLSEIVALWTLLFFSEIGIVQK